MYLIYTYPAPKKAG